MERSIEKGNAPSSAQVIPWIQDSIDWGKYVVIEMEKLWQPPNSILTLMNQINQVHRRLTNPLVGSQ